jgi:hypothetical protein
MTQQKLIDLYHQKATLKENIHQAKREANRDLRKEHKTLVRVFDFIFVLMLLANIGALVLTNALVIKKEPTKQLVELNPIAAEQYGFESAAEVYPIEKVWSAILAFYIHIIVYAGMIATWLYIRFYSINRSNFYRGMFVILFWGCALFLDFFNNLGLWIGKVLFA